MKKLKAFTLIAVMIVVSIVCLLGAIVGSAIYGGASSQTVQYNPYLFPRQAQAQATIDMAEQLRIQNQLKERELEMKERELKAKGE